MKRGKERRLTPQERRSLLLVTTFLLAETLFNLSPRVKQILWVLTFLPLGALLILQALLLIARPSKRKDADGTGIEARR